MRIVFTLLVTATVVAIHILDRPDFYVARAHQTKAAIGDFVQSKDIRIEGLKHLPRSVVEGLLPSDRSVPWWMSNSASIQSRLSTNPWVEGATIERCGDSVTESWGCFVISVQERRARFVASVDSESWILADDGTFLSPLEREDWAGVKRFHVANVVRVEGLASRVSSPDVVRSQLSVASVAIETLEEELGHRATVLTLSSRGDVQVLFKGFSFPIIFSATSDASALRDQAQRARALLPKLTQRLQEIEKVDLAFSKVGVVTFKPTNPK
jgi:hypothetical protein